MSSQQSQSKGEMPTLFAFDEGQGLSEHTTPFDVVAHVIEGEAIITISGTPRRIRSHACKPASRIEGCHQIQDAADDDSHVREFVKYQ